MTNRITAYLSDWPDNPFRGEVVEAYEHESLRQFFIRATERTVAHYLQWPCESNREWARDEIDRLEDRQDVDPGVIAELRARLGPDGMHDAG